MRLCIYSDCSCSATLAYRSGCYGDAGATQFIDTRYPRYRGGTIAQLNDALLAKFAAQASRDQQRPCGATAADLPIVLIEQQQMSSSQEELFDLSDVRQLAPAPTPMTSLRQSQTLGTMAEATSIDDDDHVARSSCSDALNESTHSKNRAFHRPLDNVQILGRRLEKVV